MTVPASGSQDDTSIELRAHVTGVCTSAVAEGVHVRAGAAVVVLESMKTEHPVEAPTDAEVHDVLVGPGDDVTVGDVVARLRAAAAPAEVVAGPDGPVGTDRPDLAEVLRRRSLLADEARPEAVARRVERGRRTARRNVEELLDAGSFSEYGGLAVAAQRGRRSIDELIERTPADGLLTGSGTIDGRPVGVLAYDATVLAGTQGFVNHRKTDRLLEVVERHRLPVVLFGEGGGGRPGDVDAPFVSGLDVPSFARFARLSGQVPTIAVVAGYCFAGNAALVGCCDVIVATEDSNLGMAGPAMIEGGGLGRVAPTDIGPIEVQAANGSVDVRVVDEAAGVAVARALVGLAAGARPAPADPHDQAPLRDAVPLARKRLYDVRAVLDRLADPGTVVELRRNHAPGMVTALARIDGRPIGVMANDPSHLGGAIDTDAARSATRLVDLCDRWGLPVLSLCDTPGFMVGPEAEATGQVRAFGDMFVAAAGARVPWVMVVLRKAYGLGAQAMAGGGMHEPVLAVSWPTGEFGGMGLEGAVRLGFARELDAIADPDERAAREAELIERAYEHGGALNVATHIEVDDVIDPIDTRRRILDALTAAG
ncbi:carboxyl transferase domain-containing protein [Dermatobacter hominis]|uniref:carboxyl transferase domain-containing protein n=1 Tax=Dermatobacter hominis TaxID=2884263 RepID=UPI001D1078CE|nr:carboxyl transferase domain-containing protein [Dermatobacter hominis]UDY36521.1 biotin carboxylase [Dermatobacter hominis]